MKKTLIAAALLGASTSAMAVAPGGPGCGWGNMLFEGQSGMPMHLLATLVNGTTGNATRKTVRSMCVRMAVARTKMTGNTMHPPQHQ